MMIVEQFNALFWSWGQMLRALRSRAALLPFAIYAAAQAGILFMLSGFAYPPFSYFVAPVLRWRFGERALHYPDCFLALRSEFGQADMILSILLGSIVLGSAVVLFAAFYSRQRVAFREAWRTAASRYLGLVAVSAIVIALSQLLSAIPVPFWADLAENAPNRLRLLRAGSLFLVLAVQSLFAFAVPYIILSGRRLRAAIRGSFVLALRNPVATFLIIAVPTALELIPLAISQKSETIASRMAPEFMIVVMLLWIGLIFLINYATVGALTRLYLHATQDESAASAGRREE